MITKINDAQDAMAALSENFTMLTTGKRKIVEAKEVTNNIGKMINLAKVQVVEKMRTGDKEPLAWLSGNTPAELPETKKKPFEFSKPVSELIGQ